MNLYDVVELEELEPEFKNVLRVLTSTSKIFPSVSRGIVVGFRGVKFHMIRYKF